jgi:RNA polymerase sigma-70 factor, ECF subfamily
MTDVHPTVIARAEQWYLGARDTVTMSTVPRIADRIPQLLSLMTRALVPPAGAPFLRYRTIDMAHGLVIEAGVPIEAPFDPCPTFGDADPIVAELFVASLPAGRYVCTSHRGAPDQLVGVTERLLRWADAEHLPLDVRPSPEGDVWGCRMETFLTDPRIEPDMSNWVTELAMRIAD